MVAEDLNYTQYAAIKSFPLFEKGANRGGIIVEQKTVREHPIGIIAERTIGYDRIDPDGLQKRVGIEGAFGKYLNGKDGKVLKQKTYSKLSLLRDLITLLTVAVLPVPGTPEI